MIEQEDTKDLWSIVVLTILKTELTKRGINYNELQKKLERLDIKESLNNIRNKLSRGTFSAIFLIQCLRAIGVTQLPLEESYFPKELEFRQP